MTIREVRQEIKERRNKEKEKIEVNTGRQE